MLEASPELSRWLVSMSDERTVEESSDERPHAELLGTLLACLLWLSEEESFWLRMQSLHGEMTFVRPVSLRAFQTWDTGWPVGRVVQRHSGT